MGKKPTKHPSPKTQRKLQDKKDKKPEVKTNVNLQLEASKYYLHLRTRASKEIS